ncbi:MAG: MarR family transcriptional regulator [Nitrosopumilales archaeon]|nr:MarR family transcriptional regulator [Nitrosopumilales archaeon]
MTDRLEKAGYVRRKRDPTDRRLIYIKPLLDKAMIKMGRRQDQMEGNSF